MNTIYKLLFGSLIWALILLPIGLWLCGGLG